MQKKTDYKNNNNSKNYTLLSLANIGVFQNNYSSRKSMPTSPNTKNKIKKLFKIKDKISKKLFILNDINNKRIQNSHFNKINNNENNYFNCEDYCSSKSLKIFPFSNKHKKTSSIQHTSKKENNKNKKNIYNLSNFSSNNLLKNNRLLSINKALKPSFPLSDEERESKYEIFNKSFKIEKKMKNALNNIIYKFDKNKLKIHSNKNIKKKIQILSENKKNKNKESMKEYYDIKKIFNAALKKKKNNISDIKSSSLFGKRILNKKNTYYKKTIRKYFSRPNREMKRELSKYLKNKHFIIDADNNPYKFRVFNSIYHF